MANAPAVRVTHVVFDLDGGGLESLVGEMVRRTAGSSVVTSVITLSGRKGRVGEAVAPHAEQFHVLKPVPVASMVLPIGLARAIRHTRPDVVHLHSGAWYKPALAARLAGVGRVVFTEHGREHYDPGLLQWLDRRAARWTSAVIAVSDRLARYLREEVGIPAGRVHTIPNGIDVERFSPGAAPGELRERLALPPGARVIGSVGRLETVKGYDRLIEAFAAARAPGGNASLHLVLCGEGSQKAALQQRAAALGVADFVRFAGWTDRPEEFYRLFSVFALTSLSEGASVSLMEAMACGAVPVVTDVGANAELLGPALAGQVIGRWDPASGARLLEATLADAGRRAALAAAARARVLERYSLAGMLAAYERVYRGEA